MSMQFSIKKARNYKTPISRFPGKKKNYEKVRGIFENQQQDATKSLFKVPNFTELFIMN